MTIPRVYQLANRVATSRPIIPVSYCPGSMMAPAAMAPADPRISSQFLAGNGGSLAAKMVIAKLEYAHYGRDCTTFSSGSSWVPAAQLLNSFAGAPSEPMAHRRIDFTSHYPLHGVQGAFDVHPSFAVTVVNVLIVSGL